jgi:D-arginine dehydrogenase
VEQVDVVVVGAGIAGAAAAFAISQRHKVCLIERQPQPGTQASGRSVTMFAIAYGDRITRALSLASRRFFEDPPPGFTDGPLLARRGMLHVASPGQEEALESFLAETKDAGPDLLALDPAAVRAQLPFLRPEMVIGGVLDRAAASIDDHRYLQACLRGLKANGGSLRCGVEIRTIEPHGQGFRLQTDSDGLEAAYLVNAAGAWADEVAGLAGMRPLSLRALRRTAVTVDPPAGLDPMGWPMAIDVEEAWYVKPEAGRLLISPADETEVPPHDVQPEEWDVAVAVDRYEQLTGETVRRIHHRWAGLRTFTPDRAPVAGRAFGHDRFIWLAGQGGAGFMTAPAMAEIAAALVDERELPPQISLAPADLAPGRRL